MNLRRLAAVLAAAALHVTCQADPVAATSMAAAALPLDQLKAAYLACDRATSRDRVDPMTFAQCVVVGDELLKRGFAGDLDKLLAWWRAEKPHDFASGRP